MRYLIRRQPFFEDRTETLTPTGPVVLRPYQVIVWISLSIRGILSEKFPAILDSGHSHNFSIDEQHISQWAAVAIERLARIGVVRVNRQPVELREADLALWRNVPGQRDELIDEKDPFHLRLPEGIAVHATGTPYAPRLPLLGLRALVRNRLSVTIDGN